MPRDGALVLRSGGNRSSRSPPLARDRLGGLDEHDVGDALQGLEFSVEGGAADAIDAGDASAPNKVEHELRAADEGEGLSDHNATSASVRQSQTAYSMNVLSPDKRDWAPRPVSTVPIFCFLRPIARAGSGVSAGMSPTAPKGTKAQKIGPEKQARPVVRPHIDGASQRIAHGGRGPTRRCDATPPVLVPPSSQGRERAALRAHKIARR